MSDSTEPRSPLADGLLAVLFGALVGAPLVVQATGVADSGAALEREMRSAAPAPGLPTSLEEWTAFPRETEAWYQDVFGLRTPLLHSYQWLHLHGYGVSPNSNLHIGPDGWVWATGEGVLDAYRGASPFPPEELAEWRETFVERQRWLESIGVDYVLVVVPGKAAVYPEHMPAYLEKRGPSRRQQFLEALEGSGVNVIDPLPALLEAKAEDTEHDHLFYPLGPHWTDRGSLVTLRYLMDRLPARHRLRPVPDDDDVVTVPVPLGEGDDLSRGFLVDDYFEQGELALRFRGQGAHALRPGEMLPSDYGMPVWGQDDEELTTALFLRDSFGRWMLPQLAQQFARTWSVGTVLFSPALAEALCPDVVVELWADHTLAWHAPYAQREFAMGDLARSFAAAREVVVRGEDLGPTLGIRPLRGSKLASTPWGVRLPTNGSQAFRLPDFEWTPDERTLLRLDVSAPESTSMSLYVPIPGLLPYRQKDSVRIPLEAGRQVVYVELPPARADGPLAMLPGGLPGDYMLHGLEVRTLPR